MSDESKQIEADVNTKLLESGVTYSVVYCGQTKRENWDCDAWRVTFSKGNNSFSTDYFTGLGCRVIKKIACMPSHGFKKVGPMQYEPTSNKNSIHYQAWAEEYTIPVKPNATSVLYSLCSDSQALNMSFYNWCSDYGYDLDSIKALNTYRACCDVAGKMVQVFTRTDISNLNELLKDY